MSPRRHHRARDTARSLDDVQVRRGVEAVERWGGDEWTVRAVPGGAATKTSRCPGCDHEISAGVAHVVTWPNHGGLADRRHWHRGCWRGRGRRGPTIPPGR